MEKKIQILVADDDDELRMILHEHLSDEGYSVSMARNGEEALLLLNNKKYNVALLDLKMPVINGYHVLKHIKQNVPETKVIVLTAYGDMINTRYCKEMGADDIVEKPYEMEDLFCSINYVKKNKHER